MIYPHESPGWTQANRGVNCDRCSNAKSSQPAVCALQLCSVSYFWIFNIKHLKQSNWSFNNKFLLHWRYLFNTNVFCIFSSLAVLDMSQSAPMDCTMLSAGCSTLLIGWTLGLPGICENSKTGIPFGLNGVKRAMLQVRRDLWYFLKY